MQTIFALNTAKEAEYNISHQKVKDKFLPDLNTMEEQDKDQLAADRKVAGQGFIKAFHTGLSSLTSDISEDITRTIENELSEYHNQIQNLSLSYKKRLIADTKKIYGQYLSVLLILPEIQQVLKSQLKSDESSNFVSNTVVQKLNDSEEFGKLVTKNGVSWQNELDTVRSWVKKLIRKDEVFVSYENTKEPSFSDDQSIVLHIFKSIIFKNETMTSYFESMDLGWSENSAVLKSMALKTIKSMEDEESELLLMELSKNWDEDLVFLEGIFDQTVKNEEEYSAIVSERSKNWEIDRVALTDKIILEMAISEMINFPSIPVKVTINEYIELSKLYSTPKSKQFINGILDVLSEELKKDGRIKKSGRGLLDNK